MYFVYLDPSIYHHVIHLDCGSAGDAENLVEVLEVLKKGFSFKKDTTSWLHHRPLVDMLWIEKTRNELPYRYGANNNYKLHTWAFSINILEWSTMGDHNVHSFCFLSVSFLNIFNSRSFKA
jgi:hypothetical protein